MREATRALLSLRQASGGWETGVRIEVANDTAFPAIPLVLAFDRLSPRWSSVLAPVSLVQELTEGSGKGTPLSRLPLLRGYSIRRAEKCMVAYLRPGNGLGDNLLAVRSALRAMDLLGYAAEHPGRTSAERRLRGLDASDGAQLWLTPVRDTAVAVRAIGVARPVPGVDLGPAAGVLLAGVSAEDSKDALPFGWGVDGVTDRYPGVVETAQALLALRHLNAGDAEPHQATVGRAIRWLLSIQSEGGGWACFGRERRLPFLTRKTLPRALPLLEDRASPGVTGLVLQALSENGVRAESPAIRGGVDYLVREQGLDGSWPAGPGGSRLMSAGRALRGLQAAGESDREAHVLRGAEWLRSVQNSDGGWGERAGEDGAAGFESAPSCAAHTAWALLGLRAGGDAESDSVLNGIRYLVETQSDDGCWEERGPTRPGLPGGPPIHSKVDGVAYPILALAVYLARNDSQQGEVT